MLLQKQIDCYNVETERKINHAVFELYGLSSDWKIMCIFARKKGVMAQVSMTIRMNEGLKASFDALCSQMGMSANKAMNSLARYFVITKKLPMEEQTSDDAVRQRGIEAFNEIWAMAEAGELPDLTMDEINEEISLYRAGK